MNGIIQKISKTHFPVHTHARIAPCQCVGNTFACADIYIRFQFVVTGKFY